MFKLLLPFLLLVVNAEIIWQKLNGNNGEPTIHYAENCDFSDDNAVTTACSKEDCRRLCSQHYSCTHYTLVHSGGQHGTCNLKTGSHEGKLIENTEGVACGFIQNKKFWIGEDIQWAQGCNFEGGNISTIEMSPEPCGATCRDHPNCTYFVFHSTNRHGTWGECVLKDLPGNAERKESSNAWHTCGFVPAKILKNERRNITKISASKSTAGPSTTSTTTETLSTVSATITTTSTKAANQLQWQGNAILAEENCDFPGEKVGLFEAGHRDCELLCKQHYLCTHYNWLPKGRPGHCYLKELSPETKPTEHSDGRWCGHIPNKESWIDEDGIKWARGCFFKGENYRRFPKTTHELCGVLCRDEHRCNHFSWDFTTGICYWRILPSDSNRTLAENARSTCGLIPNRVKTGSVAVTPSSSTVASRKSPNQDLFPSFPPWLTVSNFFMVAIFLALLVALAALLRFKLKQQRRIKEQERVLVSLYNQLTRAESPDLSEKENVKLPLDRCVNQLVYGGNREIDPANLTVETRRRLGSGEFGQVFLGTLRHQNNSLYDPIPVAVKVPLKEFNKAQYEMLCRELKISCAMGSHPNVLTFIGAITKQMKKKKLSVVVEYCELGNLKHFLQYRQGEFVTKMMDHSYLITSSQTQCEQESLLRLQPRVLSTSYLLSFALQVANGMNFISNIPCVHRDLSARNVLVTTNWTCRVADFGLAREKEYYRRNNKKDLLPYRWMSLEAIFDGLFTTKSDVWSFGIFLYELFTLGGNPYPTISNKDLLESIKEGVRNGKPDKCPQEIYDLMKSCWEEAPANRPTFDDCWQRISQFMQQFNPQLLTELETQLCEEEAKQALLSQFVSQ